jgi:hypothetical protein
MLNNVFQAESNVHWQKDQNIRLNLFGTYEKSDKYLYCQCNGTLLSSIDGIPSMSTNIKHNQTDSTFTTDVHLQVSFIAHQETNVIVSNKENLTRKLLINKHIDFLHASTLSLSSL